MRYSAFTKLLRKALLALVSSAALMFSSLAGAALVTVIPTTSSVLLGEEVVVDVAVEQLAGEIVSAYDLDLRYDDSILRVSSFEFGLELGDESFFEVLNDSNLSTAGLIDFAQISFLSDAELLLGQDGVSVILASITFETLSVGTSSLDFVLDATNDIKGLGAQILDVTPVSGLVEVRRVTNPVPEPPVVWLLLGAALWLFGRRRGLRASAG